MTAPTSTSARASTRRATPTWSRPTSRYSHSDKVVAGESCPSGSSSISGLGFYESGAFPNSYDGALFFSDYSRGCIWSMLPGAERPSRPVDDPDLRRRRPGPVDLEIHQGDLYYANLDGTIQRVRHVVGNQAPTAVATATPSNGAAPLTVQLSASGSTDPDDAFNTLELRLGRRRRRPVRRRQRRHPEPHLPGGQPRRDASGSPTPTEPRTPTRSRSRPTTPRPSRRSTPQRRARPGRSTKSLTSPAAPPTPSRHCPLRPSTGSS